MKMDTPLKIILILLMTFVSGDSFAGKKHCKPYLEKLRNVQSQQRQGHSLKRANSLQKKEQKARHQWWQCEQGKLKQKLRKGG